MAKLTKSQQVTLQKARSALRDIAHDWPIRELIDEPENIVAELTAILGDKYDFDTGDAA